MIYKNLGSKTSSRLFLSTIAFKLYKRYNFNVSLDSNKKPLNPGIGNVLYAINNPEKAQYSKKDKNDVDLLNMFNDDEYEYLQNLNYYVNQNLHGKLGFDELGKMTVVVPITFYDEETIKSIVEKSGIAELKNFVIINGGEISPLPSPQTK